MGFARVVLFALNFIVFLVAIAAIGFGLYVVFETAFDENDVLEMIGGNNFMIVAGVFAAAGLFVLVISFAGCCGAYRESTFLIVLYIILLTVVVIAECAVVGMAIFYGADVEDRTADWLEESMKEYSKDDDVTKAWDKFQRKFDCCAVNNYTEWGNLLGSIPNSCCRDDAAESCDPTKPEEFYAQGCLNKVVEQIEDNIDVLMYSGIALLVLQLLCLLLGCCAVNSFRKDIKYA